MASDQQSISRTYGIIKLAVDALANWLEDYGEPELMTLQGCSMHSKLEVSTLLALRNTQ